MINKRTKPINTLLPQNEIKQHIKKDRRAHHGFRRAFIRNKKLSVGARWLIVCLMTYKRGRSSCWPSIRKLAKDARTHRRKIRRWIKELKDTGYLKTKGQGNKSSEYWPSYIPEYKGQG